MTGPADYVRTVASGELVAELVEETKARSWVEEAEFAVLQRVTGERILVRGDQGGFRSRQTKRKVRFL